MPPILRQLLNYIQAKWIYSNIWHSTFPWYGFSRPARTNNYYEGWHMHLNAKIRQHHLPFYQLVQVLHRKPKSDQARILAA
ncbi:hypothetical protein LSH36_1107g00028 [Paralvinella palmiformis]|uniref:Uncharacterized protein n=1 Tax=Paralvinella palmiformis TaxID=53620 RepID=A0AAD9IV04_9ANNE|nr:hypothetical protein LSH36_1107g00028 [Paralvinella palmiformis]